MVIASKYEQVERQIWQQINRGTYPAGQCIPSLSELCQSMGVSRDTVRHALSILIRDGVLQARPGYGHVVRSVERKLTVGLWMEMHSMGPSPASAFVPRLLHDVRQELHRRGWRMRFYMPELDRVPPTFDYERVRRDVSRRHIGAFIAVGWPGIGPNRPDNPQSNEALLDFFGERKLPWASINPWGNLPGGASFDYETMAYVGTRHLIRQGRQRLALMMSRGQSDDVLRGYTRALDEAGRSVDPRLICSPRHISEAHGYAAFNQWWASITPQPDAILVGDDMLAKGAMTAALERGLTVQADLMFAMQASRGATVFMPRPVIRLMFDPHDLAVTVCDTLATRLVDPQATIPERRFQPTLIQDDAPVATSIAEGVFR